MSIIVILILSLNSQASLISCSALFSTWIHHERSNSANIYQSVNRERLKIPFRNSRYKTSKEVSAYEQEAAEIFNSILMNASVDAFIPTPKIEVITITEELLISDGKRAFDDWKVNKTNTNSEYGDLFQQFGMDQMAQEMLHRNSLLNKIKIDGGSKMAVSPYRTLHEIQSDPEVSISRKKILVERYYYALKKIEAFFVKRRSLIKKHPDADPEANTVNGGEINQILGKNLYSPDDLLNLSLYLDLIFPQGRTASQFTFDINPKTLRVTEENKFMFLDLD